MGRSTLTNSMTYRIPITLGWSGTDDFEIIKKNLVQLSAFGRDNLIKQQLAVEIDTKRLSLQGFQNEDQLLGSSFKSLEAQINSLQIEIDYNRHSGLGSSCNYGTCSIISNKYLTPGTSRVGTDTCTLWMSMEKKYNNLLKNLVNETVEDSMRLTGCNLWEEDLYDWDSCLSEFERQLDHQTLLHSTQFSGVGNETHSNDKSYSLKRDGLTLGEKQKIKSQTQQPVSNITPNDKLLLNLLAKYPPLFERSCDAIAEAVRLSCTSFGIPTDLQDACGELWEIIIGLCGRHRKTCQSVMEHDSLVLKDVIYNSIRSLEDLCRRQILHQLDATTDDISGEDLFNHLKLFCTLDETLEFPSTIDHYWQLLYWSYRCGSSTAIQEVIRSLQQIFSDVHNRPRQYEELDLLIMVGELLSDRLRNGSRSLRANNDSVWNGHQNKVRFQDSNVDILNNKKTNLTNGGDYSIKSLFELLTSLDGIVLNPIVFLLTSFLHPEGNSRGLKNLMPNATAEDFLWYNLNLISVKPNSRLQQDVLKLQHRIIQSGPAHFGSIGTPPVSIAFAKITALALAPTVAIDWLSKEFPELTGICLQWLIYLNQCHFAGSQISFTAKLLPDLSEFVGSVSISSAFEDLLLFNSNQPMSSGVALQLCELLPRQLRFSVATGILKACKKKLLDNLEEMSWVMGCVANDGSCCGGVLYRLFIAPSWVDNDLQLTKKHQEEALTAFESLTASLAEAAAEQDKLLQAITLSYIISQDRAAMKFLLKVFAFSSIFPHLTVPTNWQEQQQREAKKFYSIFKGRLESGELNDLTSTFDLLRLSYQVLDIYDSSSRGHMEEAWRRLTHSNSNSNRSSSFFPNDHLVALWKDSDLAAHLPKLVEVAAHCLKALTKSDSDIGKKVTKDMEGTVTTLLNTSREIGNLGFCVDPQCIQLLRSLLALTR